MPRFSRFRIGSDEIAVLSFPIVPKVDDAGLTAAEREIAAGILEGRSNAEIGRRRGTSPRTVANQIASLFRKLGVRSRAELARRLLTRAAQ